MRQERTFRRRHPRGPASEAELHGWGRQRCVRGLGRPLAPLGGRPLVSGRDRNPVARNHLPAGGDAVRSAAGPVGPAPTVAKPGLISTAADAYAGWPPKALMQADALDPLLDGSAPFDRLPPIEAWDWPGGWPGGHSNRTRATELPRADRPTRAETNCLQTDSTATTHFQHIHSHPRMFGKRPDLLSFLSAAVWTRLSARVTER